MKTTVFFLLAIAFLAGCSRPQMQVLNVNNVYNYKKQAAVYALPQTVLSITVQAQRTVLKRGPFAQYANKYLNIPNAAMADRETWAIVNASINSFAEPDSNHYYAIQSRSMSKKKNVAEMLSLSESGLIVGINSDASYRDFSAQAFYDVEAESFDGLLYPEVSAYPNYTKPDTKPKYVRIKTDTSFVRVPVLQQQIDQKDADSKAAEAAEYIFKIRQWKTKMAAGRPTALYEGAAFEQGMAELNREEEEYLSLFIGKTFVETFEYTYYFVPDNDNMHRPNILCRFSEEKGILSGNDINGIPLLLTVVKGANTAFVERYAQKQTTMLSRRNEKKRHNGLFYRIPDNADVSIALSQKTIASRKLKVAQYGAINVLPPYLLEQNYCIEFYPEYGAIKKIERPTPDRPMRRNIRRHYAW